MEIFYNIFSNLSFYTLSPPFPPQSCIDHVRRQHYFHTFLPMVIVDFLFGHLQNEIRPPNVYKPKKTVSVDKHDYTTYQKKKKTLRRICACI